MAKEIPNLKMRNGYQEYLLSKGYLKEHIEKAWKETLDLCSKYDRQYLNQEITLELLCKDILEGRNVEKYLQSF